MEAIALSHPDVSIIWNFFPLDFVIWWPVKFCMNVFFFYLWIPSIPFYEIWNFPFYGFMMVAYFISFLAVIGCAEVLVLISLLWCFLTYLYLTSLPD